MVLNEKRDPALLFVQLSSFVLKSYSVIVEIDTLRVQGGAFYNNTVFHFATFAAENTTEFLLLHR